MSERELIGLGGLAVLFFVLALRVPVGLAMVGVGIGGNYVLSLFFPFLRFDPYLQQFKSLLYGIVSNYELSVVPLFVLMGYLASQANLSRDLFQGVNAILGRFRGGVAMAAFEVRTAGSKKDQPKQTCRLYNLNIMDHVELLGGTPHAMNLEVIATPDVAAEDQSDEPVSDETEVNTFEGVDEGHEVQDLSAYETEANDEPMPADFGIDTDEEVVNEAPTSDNPEEWEAFLTAEGLGMDQLEDEDADNIYGEF